MTRDHGVADAGWRVPRCRVLPRRVLRCWVVCLVLGAAACSREADRSAARPQNVLLITIDTLRADRVGAYGYARAATPALDALAKAGVRFERAFAPAPITQTSHASLLTGRNPQGHAARHNGMRIDETVPTLAERLKAAGLATGAFVAAFPLDRRFGLARGFDVYDDAMPAGVNGRPANERPARLVVDAALAWLNQSNPPTPFFLWVHLFEPHAPYGDPANPALAGLSASDRYDREIAEADAQAGRLIAALGNRRARTLIVATADHGEAFGEHEEIGHSVFAYDTTLRVPLIMAGPGLEAGVSVPHDAGLIDVAPTIAGMTGAGALDADGADLRPLVDAARGGHRIERPYYAETFAPLLDFGWSPLRVIRSGEWKYIEAPRPELYNLREDPNELRNRISGEAARAAAMGEQLTRMGGRAVGPAASRAPGDAGDRLAALGYVGGSPNGRRRGKPGADPKDKTRVAAAIARITSGEARGAQLEGALRAVLAEDPDNPQMNLRLGFVLAEARRCAEAVPRFHAAIRGRVPTADAHLGLAGCQAAARDVASAIRTLREGARVEPGNPIVTANIGLMLSEAGRDADAIAPLTEALRLSPDLHQARFGLAIVLARMNRRDEARAAAEELLRRLPASAPQRGEVQRLLTALGPR